MRLLRGFCCVTNAGFGVACYVKAIESFIHGFHATAGVLLVLGCWFMVTFCVLAEDSLPDDDNDGGMK